MPLFSVGVRDETGTALSVYSYTRARAHRAYIVEADTEKKAQNAVKRYLKTIGKSDVCSVVNATPAEKLPLTSKGIM